MLFSAHPFPSIRKENKELGLITSFTQDSKQYITNLSMCVEQNPFMLSIHKRRPFKRTKEAS